ncbi:unnamed protein product [Toxocara canis]|uniref:Uncharacterized protein n=1 Tax=Toxocara canis TaxID=6265 RepID=A0A183UXD7_TOXCA|nr:unnamed protein product [Toxocara canis]
MSFSAHSTITRTHNYVFTDSSSKAYTTAVHLRSGRRDPKKTNVRFAMHWLAPIDRIPIPQLERMRIRTVRESAFVAVRQRYSSMCDSNSFFLH